jgi:hypothetical protein
MITYAEALKNFALLNAKEEHSQYMEGYTGFASGLNKRSASIVLAMIYGVSEEDALADIREEIALLESK